MYCREQNLTEILEELLTFTAVQRRMILQESLSTRQAGRVSPLFGLAKDAMLKSLFANNRQERLATTLVERLKQQIRIPITVWEQLASYPGGSMTD